MPYSKLKLDELKALIKTRNIEIKGKATKQTYVDALLKHDGDAPPPPTPSTPGEDNGLSSLIYKSTDPLIEPLHRRLSAKTSFTRLASQNIQILKLVLKDAFNHTDLTYEFPKGICAITGPNASGKTNIINALLYVFGVLDAQITGYVEVTILYGTNERVIRRPSPAREPSSELLFNKLWFTANYVSNMSMIDMLPTARSTFLSDIFGFKALAELVKLAKEHLAELPPPRPEDAPNLQTVQDKLSQLNQELGRLKSQTDLEALRELITLEKLETQTEDHGLEITETLEELNELITQTEESLKPPKVHLHVNPEWLLWTPKQPLDEYESVVSSVNKALAKPKTLLQELLKRNHSSTKPEGLLPPEKLHSIAIPKVPQKPTIDPEMTKQKAQINKQLGDLSRLKLENIEAAIKAQSLPQLTEIAQSLHAIISSDPKKTLANIFQNQARAAIYFKTISDQTAAHEQLLREAEQIRHHNDLVLQSKAYYTYQEIQQLRTLEKTLQRRALEAKLCIRQHYLLQNRTHQQNSDHSALQCMLEDRHILINRRLKTLRSSKLTNNLTQVGCIQREIDTLTAQQRTLQKLRFSPLEEYNAAQRYYEEINQTLTGYMESRIAQLNTETNAILEKCLPTQQLKFTYNKGVQIEISAASGYERFITNLAIVAAINKLSISARLDLLVIDECFSIVDKQNIARVKETLTQLQPIFRTIVLVSHTKKITSIAHSTLDLAQK